MKPYRDLEIQRRRVSDGNENFKTAIGLISKTTTLHVEHTFCVHFFILPSPARPKTWKFCGGWKQATTKFSFSYSLLTPEEFAYIWQRKLIGITTMTNSPLSYGRSGNLRSLKPYIKTLSMRKSFETFSHSDFPYKLEVTWKCLKFSQVWLSGLEEARWFFRRRYVLVRPWWRKPFKRVPGLLWHDVIQWRMDHVLHNWWIHQTQDWNHLQSWASLWNGRVQNELQPN